MPDNRMRCRFLRCWLPLIVIGLGAIWLRCGGFDRGTDMHPDQPRIMEWMNRAEQDGYLKGVVYPGGFFRLYVNFKRVADIGINAYQHWQYRLGHIDRRVPVRNTNFLIGRWMNILLAAATCLLLHLAAKSVSGSARIGWFCALLLCFAPVHIMHSHYLQTDIAMVFTLTAALYLWLLYAKDRRWWMFAAAAAVSGFAAGTKYTLVCIAPLIIVFGLYPGPDAGAQRVRRMIGLCIAGLALFAAGFIVANPAVMRWESFRAGMLWQGARVYGEGVTLQGQARGLPWLQLRTHWRALLTSMAYLQATSWPAAAIGLAFALTGRYRRYWPVLIGFPAIYLYYYLFKSPWVRDQEFMNFLPVWALLAGIGIKELWGAAANGAGRRMVLRTASVLLALATLLPLARAGMLTGSQFNWTDVRRIVNLRLQRHMPFESSMGLERYTAPVHHDVCENTDFIYKIEIRGTQLIDEQNFEFVMRNPTTGGRGLRHPLTGALYPNFQANFDAFTNRAERLAGWGLLPPDRYKHIFSSPDLELWGANHAAAKTALQLPLPRPAYISPRGRETFFPGDRILGGTEAMLIDKYPRQWAFGGPGGITNALFALVNTYERPAEFRLRGFGKSNLLDLPPYSAGVIRLQRPFWKPRLSMFEILTASTRATPHILYIPCLLRPAFDKWEAAASLYYNGHAGQALQLVRAADTDESGHVLTYLLAVARRDWELADQRAPAADSAMRKMAAALAGPSEHMTVNTINGRYHDRFARIRLAARDIPQRLLIAPENSRALEDCPWLPPGTTMPIPVRLAHGRYRFNAEMRVRPQYKSNGHATGNFAVYDQRGILLADGPWSAVPEQFTPMDLPLAAGMESEVRLHFVSSATIHLEYRNPEIQWSLPDQLQALFNDLIAARIRHHLHQGAVADAAAAMAQADCQGWNAPEIARLELALLRAQQADTDRLQAAARRVLAMAPADLTALEIAAPEQARTLAGNLAAPVDFPPFLRLMGARRTDAGSATELIFEVLADDIPPLMLALHRRRGRQWRRQTSIPLTPDRRLYRNERVRITIDPQQIQAVAGTLADIGLSVTAARQWSPGTLQPAGRPGTVIPLTELLSDL